MLEGFLLLLEANPVLTLFLVLGVGYLIGRIQIAGFGLGPVGGVLFAGLIFGYFGFDMSPAAQTFGFTLFIFCVGYQAGPRFFDVLMTDGLKYLALAMTVAATGFAATAWLGDLLRLPAGSNAGLLAGAMTTTPTLAAAQDAIRAGVVAPPPGISAEEMISNVGTSYAITYLFGLIGLILLIRGLPKVLGVDLAAEAASIAGDDDWERQTRLSRLGTRAYRVENPEFLHKSLLELRQAAEGKVVILRIRRNGAFVALENKTRLEIGDEVLVAGDIGAMMAHAPRFGSEIVDEELLSTRIVSADVVVTNPEIAGHSLREIGMRRQAGVVLLAIRRQRVELPIEPELVLRRGDVLSVHGPEASVEYLKHWVGHVERDVDETDLMTFAFAIVAGLAIGTLAVTIGGVSIGLGSAGGLLLTGLVVGFLRSSYPVFGRVPGAALWVFMELGLLMFMAGVGLNAGEGIVDAIKEEGLRLVAGGIVVTVLPVLVGYAFGRKVLGLNPAELMGGLAGSMTSGAALQIVTSEAKSPVPALGYTGAYAFANVILTIAGSLILLF
jgi:putative transport protein